MTPSKSEGEKEAPPTVDAGKDDQGEAVETGEEAAQEDEAKPLPSTKQPQVQVALVIRTVLTIRQTNQSAKGLRAKKWPTNKRSKLIL